MERPGTERLEEFCCARILFSKLEGSFRGLKLLRALLFAAGAFGRVRFPVRGNWLGKVGRLSENSEGLGLFFCAVSGRMSG